MPTPITKPMTALTSSFSMMRSIKLSLCSISGMSAQQRISKVQSVEDKVYLLRYDEEADEWTLQSGFDGDELLIRPSIQLVMVDPATTKKAEQQIESCEHCHPDDAEIPFDWILADVMAKRGPYEFILTEAARCPYCKCLITEKTLIEPKGN
jgi:hypothetical protein